MADILQKIVSNLYDGEDQEVAELVQEALDQGLEPGEILRGGSSPAWTRWAAISRPVICLCPKC